MASGHILPVKLDFLQLINIGIEMANFTRVFNHFVSICFFD